MRVGSWRWLGPPTPQFCVSYTNMLVLKYAKISLPSMPKPQRKSVEYRLRWVPNAKFLCWQCTFNFLCVVSFAFGGQRKPSFQWNMGIRKRLDTRKLIQENPRK